MNDKPKYRNTLEKRIKAYDKGLLRCTCTHKDLLRVGFKPKDLGGVWGHHENCQLITGIIGKDLYEG
jgi:hypothetical protein